MAWVWGTSSSRFARQPDRTASELCWEAVAGALADAGVDRVDAVFVGSVFAAPGAAQRALHPLGVVDVPIVTVENACASGTTAFHEANVAIDLGRYDVVLALGVEQMTTRFEGPITPEATDLEGSGGMSLPALYAMSASRYLHEGLVTREQLASVAVKNNAHAAKNDLAQYGGIVSVQEVLDSRMIAEPLTLRQCCPLTDAAAAAVLGNRSRGARDVPIRTTTLRSGALWDANSEHVWGFEIVRDSARDAFAKASIEPTDIDVCEVHDAFTIGEIVTTEALGLAPVGEAGRLVASGHFSLASEQVVNPSGGLLARGHPLGATGLAQIGEIVAQLRGEAGVRQATRSRIGVVETMGGGVSGIDGNACVVAVLERPVSAAERSHARSTGNER